MTDFKTKKETEKKNVICHNWYLTEFCPKLKYFNHETFILNSEVGERSYENSIIERKLWVQLKYVIYICVMTLPPTPHPSPPQPSISPHNCGSESLLDLWLHIFNLFWETASDYFCSYCFLFLFSPGDSRYRCIGAFIHISGATSTLFCTFILLFSLCFYTDIFPLCPFYFRKSSFCCV